MPTPRQTQTNANVIRIKSGDNVPAGVEPEIVPFTANEAACERIRYRFEVFAEALQQCSREWKAHSLRRQRDLHSWELTLEFSGRRRRSAGTKGYASSFRCFKREHFCQHFRNRASGYKESTSVSPSRQVKRCPARLFQWIVLVSRLGMQIIHNQ